MEAENADRNIQYKKRKLKQYELVSRGRYSACFSKKISNGYKSFVSCAEGKMYKGDCITRNNDGDGGAGLAYYP